MPIRKKSALVAAAIAGLMASSTVAMAGGSFPGNDSMNKTHCDMNSCKGAGPRKDRMSCKGAGNACGGTNACKGSASAAKVENGQLKTQ